MRNNVQKINTELSWRLTRKNVSDLRGDVDNLKLQIHRVTVQID